MRVKIVQCARAVASGRRQRLDVRQSPGISGESLSTALTLVDFTTLVALLAPGASYWLLASMPDLTATAYWWAADIPQGAYPVAVAYNEGVFMPGSHTQP